MDISKINSELLDRITAAYNKEIAENHASGELDCIPKDSTPQEVLTVILTKYALQNFPGILEKESEA